QTTALGPAQGYHVTSWTTENGLPQNTVRCLAQTPDGYIWAGTGNGLARFDGVCFRVFTRELLSTDGLDASCLELKVDGNGRLWIRLPDALVCYDQGRFERFATKSPDGNGAIQTILASRNDGLWLG